MNLENYIKDAIRTESPRDQLIGNPQLVVNLLNIFICAGRMLDQVKKHMFYEKPYDANQFNGDFQSTINTLQHLTIVRINGSKDEMGEIPIENINPRIFHAIIGTATETTELCEVLYDMMTNQKIDLVNMTEEVGDCCWYFAVLFDAIREMGYDGSWNETLEKNIAKLKSRYPEKFSNKKAIHRDEETEREILENF